MSIKAYFLTPEGTLQSDLTLQQIHEAYSSKQGLLWVDVSETTAEDGRFLEHELGLHNLAVEDCVSTQIHSPKIDNFDDYLFVVVHGINHVIEPDTVETAELALFIGKNYVISNHNFPLYSIGAVQQKVEENDRLMRRGVDFLAHALIDTLIDNVRPTIDRMNDFAEEIEEEVIHRPQQSVLDAIMKLKRSALKVHRVMAPQRDVLNRLSRGEFPIIKKDSQIFFRDIYDHVVRIEDLVQSLLDRADNALATYLSSVANRQNETMRVLSIVATIFMPLTLLVGIYGMNFEHMPELTWRWGYFMVLGIIGFVILVLIWRFWASGWFAWGRRRITWVKPFMVEGKKIQGYLTSNLKKMSKLNPIFDLEEKEEEEDEQEHKG
ncbi:MAG: magnesium/cobalt transporter CorA [Dehalococcoidia bacterium]|jgi:magnesium transporter